MQPLETIMDLEYPSRYYDYLFRMNNRIVATSCVVTVNYFEISVDP